MQFATDQIIFTPGDVDLTRSPLRQSLDASTFMLPGDWMEIVEGRVRSDYMENGFLWDRVGLAPPDGE